MGRSRMGFFLSSSLLFAAAQPTPNFTEPTAHDGELGACRGEHGAQRTRTSLYRVDVGESQGGNFGARWANEFKSAGIH